MRVMVTGATGYVGQHIVPKLLAQNHEVIAVARNEVRAQTFNWYKKVIFISNDFHANSNIFTSIDGSIDALIHLAWPNLPNYEQSFHLTKNLPADIRFFEEALNFGIPQLIVAGTCLEYGMKSGGISENSETNPITSYGLAKDTLRKWLEIKRTRKNFILQWMRLFYSYGAGQSEKSLFSQLDSAINRGDDIFNMSGGEQLRDYLSIEEIADYFVKILNNPDITGAINCCSGNPIKINDLVSQYLIKKECDMKLNKSFYPYPKYEPMEFWGILDKLKMLS